MATLIARRQGVVLSLICGAALVASCATTINHVLADPSRYRDREVKLSGTVSDSYGFLENGAYRLKDDTGEIWVVSSHGVPRNGAKVTVEGTIREGANLGAFGSKLPAGIASGLVLMESSHSAK
jgi:hypothetical protein